MSTKIKAMCPKCQHILTVEIATIDTLRAENERLRQELARLKRPTGNEGLDYLKGMLGMKK